MTREQNERFSELQDQRVNRGLLLMCESKEYDRLCELFESEHPELTSLYPVEQRCD
ncbi:hypothetical protein MELB17_00050 [Marinobacter sp. ELB17]|nr:hypothetical protein MELB17_00050 [Marinobacter sp. ELB17]